MTTNYDVALAMNAATLSSGMLSLYGKPDARSKLFMGSVSQGTVLGNAVVTWDVQASPTFVLAPPTATQWAAALKPEQPVPPLPTTNAFDLQLGALNATLSLAGGAPIGGTTSVDVFATVTQIGDKIALTPVAISLDESKMTGWDKIILNGVLLPALFKAVTALLAGITLPAIPAFAGVTLGTPTIVVQQALVLGVACLSTGGDVNIDGVTWPQQPLFLQVSPAVVNRAASYFASTLTGAHTSGSFGGDYGVFSADASYSASVTGVTATVSATDLTVINASITASVQASGHASSPGCSLTLAAKILGIPPGDDTLISLSATIDPPTIPVTLGLQVPAATTPPAAPSLAINVTGDVDVHISVTPNPDPSWPVGFLSVCAIPIAQKVAQNEVDDLTSKIKGTSITSVTIPGVGFSLEGVQVTLSPANLVLANSGGMLLVTGSMVVS